MKLETVMVIDDSEEDQFLSKVTIQSYDKNIKILQAHDGKDALEILATLDKQPDVIFLDINMPIMNGHEFLSIYSAHKEPSAVVIMLTSSDQKIDRDRSQAYACVKQYLIKPLKKEDLVMISNL